MVHPAEIQRLQTGADDRFFQFRRLSGLSNLLSQLFIENYLRGSSTTRARSFVVVALHVTLAVRGPLRDATKAQAGLLSDTPALIPMVPPIISRIARQRTWL
jgi:hypothetical protein